MNNNSARIKQYSKVSTSLACLSNEKLKQILADAKPMHEGIGGKSALISIDDDHYYLDLLFFNRKLKRLVAIELKSGKFKPQYKGQMELYLGWLKQFEMLEGENPPIGIILCTEKSTHQIELLDMENSPIHIAEYWTELPPQDVFERKIREIVFQAQEKKQKNLEFQKDKE